MPISPNFLVFSSPRSPLPTIPPHLHVCSFLFATISLPHLHHRLALADASTGRSLTFLQFSRYIHDTARALSFLGITQHDVVLLVSPNSIHFPVVFLAIISLGAIATSTNPNNTSDDILKQANHSNAKLIITVAELVDKIRPSGLPILLIDGETKVLTDSNPLKLLSQIIKQSAHHTTPHTQIQQSDPAALLYTSGTTGASKAAIITHKNFIATALQSKLADDGSAGGQTSLCCVPMFHAFGLSVIVLAQLYMGNTIIIMAKFNIPNMLSTIATYQVTNLPVVPPIMVALTKYVGITNYDLSSVTEVMCGAGRVGSETMEEVYRRLPNAIVRLDYGMTEATGRVTVTMSKPTTRKSSSVGPLVSGMEAVVIDPSSGKHLPSNMQGELWIRGPNIMQGYLNNREATATAIDEDGWLRTGDLVFFDEKANLHIVGRLKDLIKYKGLQVAPVELETLLMTHPSIVDTAVVPFPDDYAGEIPLAYIVRGAGSSLSEQDVIQFVEAKVAPHKKIRKVKFVESLPKTGSGKVIRRNLISRL